MKFNQKIFNVVATTIIMMFCVLSVLMMCVLAGCTYSINMAHTEGHASDLIDETQDAQAEVVPTLTIPASVL